MTTSPRDPDTHARHPHLPAEETGALDDATIAALTQITGAPPEESFVLVRTMIDRPPTQVAIDDLIAGDTSVGAVSGRFLIFHGSSSAGTFNTTADSTVDGSDNASFGTSR